MFIYFIFQINTRTLSTVNTAAHASSATVIRLFSLYAAISKSGCSIGTGTAVTGGMNDATANNVMWAQDIEIYIMTHEMLPPSLPPDRNKLPGLLPEVL